VTASVTWTNVSIAFPVPSACSVADFNMEITLIYQRSYYICKLHAAAIGVFLENISITTTDCGKGDRIQSLAFRQIHV